MTTATAVQVKERPIIFGADSVRAILSGAKTQTRRVVKNPDKYDRIRECGFCCPYGQPGERLWVRETWKHYGNKYAGGKSYALVAYGDDTSTERDVDVSALPEIPKACIDDYWHKKRSPIFMPRWASRINLEVTNVRVERVQEITREDALAEGVREMFKGKNFELREERMSLEQHAYAEAWDSLNAKRGFSWDSNPFVWVISFKPVAD